MEKPSRENHGSLVFPQTQYRDGKDGKMIRKGVPPSRTLQPFQKKYFILDNTGKPLKQGVFWAKTGQKQPVNK